MKKLNKYLALFLLIFTVAAVTDWLDGYVARGSITSGLPALNPRIPYWLEPARENL